MNYYYDMEENNEEYLEGYLADTEDNYSDDEDEGYLSDENYSDDEDENIFWNYPTPSLGTPPTAYELWCWSQFNRELNLTLIPDCERESDWM